MRNVGVGIELLFLGMGVVFFALIVIICVMKSLQYFSGTNKKKAEHQVSEKSAAASVSSSMNFSGVSAETVAAISGAIAYMMGSAKGSYAIRSIRPCIGRESFSPWAIAGRFDQVNAGNFLIKRRTSR